MSRFTKKRAAHRPARKLALEVLEARYAPAVNLNLATGTLEIVGGVGSDYAFVWEDQIGYEAIVHVNLNGTVTHHLKAAMPKGIRFSGLGGDDFFSSTANAVVKAKGGNGNDYIAGGSANDALYGGNGHDTLLGNVGNDALSGEVGNDSLAGGAGTDVLFGHEGNDSMVGGNDKDTLWGYDGHDTLDGGGGNDELSGDGGNDSLLGGSGKDYMEGGAENDTLAGGSKSDTLYGSDGDDVLHGEGGGDQLFGGYGNDDLYGGDDSDDLQGQEGLDGLFGGLGVDLVSGGSGPDRFLTLDINGDDWGVWDYDFDDLTDVADEDALIIFENDNAVWSMNEVERVDGGLARLHKLLGKTALLKDPQHVSDDLHFYRRIQDDTSPGNNGTNNGTSVLLYDVTFQSSANWVAFVTIHELGHFWDEQSENSFVKDFRDLSEWTTKYGSGDKGDIHWIGNPFDEGAEYFVKAEDDNWWYKGGSLFVTDYAATNPFDDFADTFTAVVMGDDFSRNENDTPLAPTEKRDLIADWLEWLETQ